MQVEVSKLRSTSITLQNNLDKAYNELEELHKKLSKPKNDDSNKNKDHENLIKTRNKLAQYKEIIDKRDTQMLQLTEEK